MSALIHKIEGQDCVIGVMKDVTESIEVEAALKENEKQLDLFFNNSLEGFFFMMLDEPIEWHDGMDKEAALDYVFENQRITKINQAILDQYRAKASDFLGFRPKDFFAHDISSGRQIWRGLFDRGRWKVNTDERRLDGSQMWVEGDYICLYDEQGRITGHFGVQRDITEQRKAAIALSQAKEAAEAAAKAKSEFLANMSHEIRTPMNGVLGMIEVLLQTPLNQEQKDYLQTIQESGDTLLVIINDILDFSKIEAGNLQLDQSEFAIEGVLQSICSLLRSKAYKKGIRLDYQLHPQVPQRVRGDSNRFRQVLINLVGNALKFTEQGSVQIDVTSQATQNPKIHEFRVAVQDTGIGIPRDRISYLFQPFTQADASINRKYGGTGLGLAISKRLVELMGGTIWVESGEMIAGTPPQNWDSKKDGQQGSTFYFTLTLEEIAPTSPSSSGLPSDSQLSSLPDSSLRILLAEDNRINQKVAIQILKRLGYQAEIANNGVEVLAKLQQQSYDVILMDVQMPEMDGLETTRRISWEYPVASQPYIIAMTANAMEGDREACLAAGMQDYLSKPIRIQALTTALQQYQSWWEERE